MTRKYKIREDIIDEIGNKYSMLTVIERSTDEVFVNPRGARWKCLCECGNYCVATGSSLREGKRKSCGCLREKTIEYTGVNRLMLMYRRRAWKNHHVFNLSKEDFYKLIKGDCFYCGIKPQQVLKRQKTNLPQIIYNGIDRVDSSKGYNPANCVSSCRYCNQAKSTMTLDEFKAHIKRIHSWLMIDS